MTNRILSIGECMVELAQTAPGQYAQGFAGDTFNTAWHLKRQLPPDWEVSYFTALGQDPTSDAMLRFMAGAGIDITDIQRLPGAMPGLYMIATDAAGERSFSYWRGQSAARRLADDPAALAASIARADHVVVSGISLAILPPKGRATLLHALADAKTSGKTVAFDSNLRPALWENPDVMRTTLAEAAQTATIALPTWPDDAVLGPDASQEAVAARYRAAGVAEVVVKAGPNPALIVTGTGEGHVPTGAVTPRDTTGAGDSFNAGYLAARLTGATALAAARAGHDLAAQVLQVRGALLPN